MTEVIPFGSTNNKRYYTCPYYRLARSVLTVVGRLMTPWLKAGNPILQLIFDPALSIPLAILKRENVFR